MTECDLYSTISASMPFQMALDDILFYRMVEARARDEAVRPMLRFYFSDRPWLSLGYAYSGWKAWKNGTEDLSVAANEKLPVCRRITGGGRVVHGRDIMFSILAPKELDESFKSVRMSYLKVHEVLQAALKSLGVETRFYRCDEDLPHGKDCFVFPIATDLAAGKHKIAGGGQKRSAGILLHQESVQVKGLDPEEFIAAFSREWKEAMQCRFSGAHWQPEWFPEAEALGEAKYHVGSSSQTRAGTDPNEGRESQPVLSGIKDGGAAVR